MTNKQFNLVLFEVLNVDELKNETNSAKKEEVCGRKTKQLTCQMISSFFFFFFLFNLCYVYQLSASQ